MEETPLRHRRLLLREEVLRRRMVALVRRHLRPPPSPPVLWKNEELTDNELSSSSLANLAKVRSYYQ